MHLRRGRELGVAARLSKLLLLAGVSVGCAGCIGMQADFPITYELLDPVPHKVPKRGDRMACQPDSDATTRTRYTKDQFQASWGAPREKLATAKGETWVYADGGQWCGLWVFVIVPVPLRLPVCDAYERVVFEGDVAVSSTSHRVVSFGLGLGLHPAAPVPFPFMVRPGSPRTEENCRRTHFAK